MEIERKFLIRDLPKDLKQYPFHRIEQGYLSVNPVVRIRRQDEDYYLTYKSSGMMAREEYNLPLTGEAYEHMRSKTDGNLITKTRYCIPLDDLTIELDIFEGAFCGLVVAEVEFESIAQAQQFVMPTWFEKDVTWDSRFHNSYMSTADPGEYGL